MNPSPATPPPKPCEALGGDCIGCEDYCKRQQMQNTFPSPATPPSGELVGFLSDEDYERDVYSTLLEPGALAPSGEQILGIEEASGEPTSAISDVSQEQVAVEAASPYPAVVVYQAVIDAVSEIARTQAAEGGGNYSRDLYPLRAIVDALSTERSVSNLDRLAEIDQALKQHRDYPRSQPPQPNAEAPEKPPTGPTQALSQTTDSPLPTQEEAVYEKVVCPECADFGAFDDCRLCKGSTVLYRLLPTGKGGGA